MPKVVTWGGLRGGISVALVSITFIIVLFSVLVQGVDKWQGCAEVRG